MSEGKKVKLTFHVVVANYCGNLAVSSITFDAATGLVTMVVIVLVVATV
jgi:hypothetical protein